MTATDKPRRLSAGLVLALAGAAMAASAPTHEQGVVHANAPARAGSACSAATGVRPGAPTTQATAAVRPDTLVPDGRRLVKLFDFNERPLGNYEPLPMGWTRHEGWGFPHYLEAGFDEAVGHEGPPSLRLNLNGGSVGFHYRSRTIEVVPTSDYVVFAWVRTEGLNRARASIGAAMMDRSGNDIPGTQTFSRFVGGPAENGRWHRLTAYLPGGVRNARFVHLSVWLTQRDARTRERRGTPASADDVEDTSGQAWFDDIEVYRLPRVRIDTGVPGNVFGPGCAPALHVLVNDPDGTGLVARLVVRDADDTVRFEQDLPIKPNDQTQPDRMGLPGLESGLYHAELSVSTAAGVLAARTLQFARLSRRYHNDDANPRPARGFGVAVNNLSEKHLADQLALIEQLGAEWVKMPVWLMASANSSGSAVSMGALESHLTQISGRGHEVVGWIGPDRQTLEQRREVGSLLDLLSSSPTRWRPGLAYVWSLYAGLIRWWQVGNEQDASLVWDPRLPAAVAAVRREMSDVVDSPRLVIPGNVLRTSDGGETDNESPPPSAVAAFVPPEVPPERIDEHPPAADARPKLWLTIAPLPRDRYPRRAWAADLTKRLVLAKAGRAEAIFVPQPWTVDDADGIRPNEEYLIFRTVADLLGGSQSVGTLTIDGRVECHVFDRDGRAVLAVWDDYAPPAGRDHWLLLDPGARQIDPWGRCTDLQAAGAECRVRIGPTPTFLEPLPTWLAKLRRSFGIVPSHVEARLAEHEAAIRFVNPLAEPISGEVRLVAPPGWTVRPSRFRFSLPSGQVHQEPISLSFPLNEPSGTKVILSEFLIEANRNYPLRIPAWFELGLEGIEVETFTQRAGDQVVVRQSVTNRSGEVVSFYGYLAASGRERLNRIISNLQPGETATKEYVLDNASELTGHRMRLGLQEVDGSRVWNCLIEAP